MIQFLLMALILVSWCALLYWMVSDCTTSESFPKSWTVHHDANQDKRNAPTNDNDQ